MLQCLVCVTCGQCSTLPILGPIAASEPASNPKPGNGCFDERAGSLRHSCLGRSAWAAAAAAPPLRWWGPGAGMCVVDLPALSPQPAHLTCNSAAKQSSVPAGCHPKPSSVPDRELAAAAGGNTLGAVLGGQAVEEVLGKPGPRPPKAFQALMCSASSLLNTPSLGVHLAAPLPWQPSLGTCRHAAASSRRLTPSLLSTDPVAEHGAGRIAGLR